MRLQTNLLILVVAFFGTSSAQATDPDAIEVAHVFFVRFMKAINKGDLLQVLPLISPQAGNTNIDGSKLIQELKGLRVSFHSAHFVNGNKKEVSVSTYFRAPRSEKASKTAEFVLELLPNSDPQWTIKSMSDIKSAPSAAKGFMGPPLVMG